MASRWVAALYVERGGAYAGLRHVDPWDELRDARLYPGPFPVVAHPPCARWGRYWFGGPSAAVRRERGDDGGLFEHALASVMTWGGVLEHPAHSSAWPEFWIEKPPIAGGWIRTGGGYTCHVEQGHYGHRARKATWLYAHGMPASALPRLRWGPSEASAWMDAGYQTAEKRRAWVARGGRPWAEGLERLSKAERAGTPEAFRDLLLRIARSAG